MIYYKTTGRHSKACGLLLLLVGLLILCNDAIKSGFTFVLILNGLNGVILICLGVYTLRGKNTMLGNPEVKNGKIIYTDFGGRIAVDIRNGNNIITIDDFKLCVKSLGSKKTFYFGYYEKRFKDDVFNEVAQQGDAPEPASPAR